MQRCLRFNTEGEERGLTKVLDETVVAPVAVLIVHLKRR